MLYIRYCTQPCNFSKYSGKSPQEIFLQTFFFIFRKVTLISCNIGLDTAIYFYLNSCVCILYIYMMTMIMCVRAENFLCYYCEWQLGKSGGSDHIEGIVING